MTASTIQRVYRNTAGIIEAMPTDPRAIPRHPFVRRVARALRHRCGVAAEDRLLIAVSGGADSVALLRAMHALSHRRGWSLSLTVAHVQHHLRPADEAEADAQFVFDLAQALRLPLDRRDVRPGEAAGNVEGSARRMRYGALAEMAAEHRTPWVVTGHHGDDQLETVLMRLLRGASVRGLAGMAWRRRLIPGAEVRLIRPMLAVTHDEAVAFLRDLGQGWREDATNLDTSRWRARLRREVLPVMRALRGDVAHKAVALGEHLRDVARLIDDAARSCDVWVERGNAGWSLPRARARPLNPAVLMALCRRLLMEAGVPGDALRRRVLEPVVRAIRDGRGGSRRFALPGGASVRVTRDTVTLTPGNPVA